VAALSMALGAQSFAANAWLENFGQAFQTSKSEGKPMLVNFTSSDACPACMFMKRQVFDTAKFQKFAGDKLVLLEVDFPRAKMLPPQQTMQNRELVDEFGIMDENGMISFPTLAVVTPKGEIVALQKGAFRSPEDLVSWVEDSLRQAQAGS